MTILQVKYAICLFMPIHTYIYTFSPKLKGLEREEKLQVGFVGSETSERYFRDIKILCPETHGN